MVRLVLIVAQVVVVSTGPLRLLDRATRENEILVDGLPTTNPSDETYTLTPSPDSIQMFKVLTTPFSAEYGYTGGGVMIATSRSGSNSASNVGGEAVFFELPAELHLGSPNY